MEKFFVRFLVMLVIVLNFCSQAYSFTDTYGAGIRANSMGGAFTAIADDYSASYYNPAGLAQHTGMRFSLDYFYAKPDIQVKTIPDGQNLIVEGPGGTLMNDPVEGVYGSMDIYGPIIGIEVDVNQLFNAIYKLPINVQLGILVGVPENGISLWRIVIMPADQPHFISFGDVANHLELDISAGAEVIKDLLSLGAGVSLSLSAESTLFVPNFGLDDPSTVPVGSLPGKLKTAPLLGVLFTPFDKKVKIGFTFRQESCVEIKYLDMFAEVPIGPYEPGLAINVGILSAYRPNEYDFGLAFDLNRFLLSFDISYQMWGNYKYTEQNAYFYSPENPELNGIETGSPDFDDTMEYKVGIKYKYSPNISILTGYQQAVSPVPDQSGRISNYIDLDRNIYSAGFSYLFDKMGLTVSGLARYAVFDGFEVIKTGVKGHTWGYGDSEQQSYEIPSGNVIMIGGGMSIAF